MNPGGGCLDESIVVAFLGGTLPVTAREDTEAHLATCSACADLVTWAAADIAVAASRAPGSEGRPFVGQLTPGSRVGRYQVLGAVGRGGMGEVYAAYHPDLDRRIALKVVFESGANMSERRARLLREARAIARLSHPNVVAVHDAGTLGDRVFIAMEFVDGQTVDDWLRAAPRSWQRVLDVFIAAGRGLAAAHAAGIVHRDFKPQNVMIGRDGSVRVMDFGLARLLHEETGAAPDVEAGARPAAAETVTKTGALLGTPAYMSPEQFRGGGAIDARSDQFSFCVALREALADAPGWLRGVVLRGAAIDRDQRYESMAQLLAALERGRTRLRRRASALAAAVTVTVVAAGGWKLARSEHVACSLPKDRIAAAWSAGEANQSRPQAVRRAFLASGRPHAELSWQRLAATLDEYIGAWSSMYLQTCEATHVRGEQSAEVLDLRMSCLNDNLDQVRALTDTLATADAEVVSHAVAAAKDLTPVARCADIPLLRSAVPLPRDERTLREVQRLKRSLAEIQKLHDVGKHRLSLAKASALRPEVEATGYKPLLGQLLETIGFAQTGVFTAEAEETLENALYTAEAARDDATAARAAATLVYTVGVGRGKYREAERWARLANAILDRGASDQRTRAWVLQNHSAVLAEEGNFERALVLLEQGIALKEQSLGRDHPDVALSLQSLAWALTELGRPNEALPFADEAIAIHARYTDPSSFVFASAVSSKGASLLALGRTQEAMAAFESALRGVANSLDRDHPLIAETTTGLGEIELAEGRLAHAVTLLQRATEIYKREQQPTWFASKARFALARALWKRDVCRRREAISLATQARNFYAGAHRADRVREVDEWLSRHSNRTIP
jgi:eukaryotic-like serine/threonine-protein kinase